MPDVTVNNGSASVPVTIAGTSVTVTVSFAAVGPAGAAGEGVPVGGTTGQILAKASGTNYDTEWITAAGTGDLLASNNLSDVDNAATAFANIKQAASTSVTGVVELATDGESSAGVVVQGNDSRLSDARDPNTHASNHTDGTDDIQSATNAQKGLATAAHITAIEANTAKLTCDTSNVTAAGALMDSEVTSLSGIKTLSVPDSTTISAFGASLMDDSDAATARTTLGLGTAATSATGDFATAAQGLLAASAQQPPTEGAFVDGDKTKLDGIESGADVTDATNVTAAGALMDSEVANLSGIKTLSVPDNTTISAFGASLTDDPDAATARTTLGVDAAGTDNSTDVTIAAGRDYISITGQELTLGEVDLTADVTGALPVVNGGTGQTSLGAVDAAALGSGAAADGYVLTADGAGGSAWEAVAGGGGGSGTKTYAVFTPLDAQPPATNFATLDTRNSIAVLDFDGGSTNEETTFVGILPEAADVSSGLKVRIHWMATSATSGDCRWGVQFEKAGTDLDSDSFDTATEAHSTTNGTSGIETVTEINATSIDSITAGDRYRIKVYRDASDTTNDTMTGDAELIAVEIRSAV